MAPSFSTAQHLLLFSPNWLGDVVMALPAFQQWRAAHPGR
ncbi:MAG: glycosyltransferase family 9 protein, partial [Lentisphaerae bacterium]|nr:glycosyltransferase family 9 protein [Lentisphaerota bacterium]